LTLDIFRYKISSEITSLNIALSELMSIFKPSSFYGYKNFSYEEDQKGGKARKNRCSTALFGYTNFFEKEK
jgi:hypothetical protein